MENLQYNIPTEETETGAESSPDEDDDCHKIILDDDILDSKMYLDTDQSISDEDGIENIVKLYEAGLVLGLQTSKHSINKVNLLPEKFGVTQKEIEGAVEIREFDYTLLEPEVWEEEPETNQIFYDPARDKWFEAEGCIACALGFAMCGYSLWTFPELCVKYGTTIFCCMSFIITCILTVPAIYLEMILGQFSQTGPFHSWKVTPLFTGLGAAMFVNTFISVLMNNTRVVLLAFYACESFRNGFPWSDCSREWTTINCRDFNTSNDDLKLDASSRSPAYEYYRARVLRVWKSSFADDVLTLHPFDGSVQRDDRGKKIAYPNATKSENGKQQYNINDIGVPSLDLLSILAIVYILAYCILRYRIRFMGAVNFCLLLLGYLLLSVTFTYVWILPERTAALKTLVVSGINFSTLLRGEAWVAVVKHSLIASGLGTGMYILIGSHWGFANRRIKNIALAAGFGSWATHCFVAVIMTMFWETAMSYKNTGAFSKSYFGTDTVIEIFPLIIGLGSRQKVLRFYSFCFYFGLVCLSIVRTICGIFLLKRTVMDSYKQLFDSFRIFYDPNERGDHRRFERLRLILDDEQASIKLLLIFLTATCLSTIPCLTRGGIYIQLFLENYCYGISFTFVFFIEVLTLTYIWGIRDIDKVVKSITFYQSTIFYRFTWKYVLPAAISLFIIHRGAIPNEIALDGNKLPRYCHYIGIAFSSIPFLIILALGVKGIIEIPLKMWKNKFILSLAPQYYWSIMISGQLGSTRTHWIHYMNFPKGFGEGPGFPKSSEEMYYTCRGCGNFLRQSCRNKCSLRIYSNNLLFLKFTTPKPRVPAPGKPMELTSEPETKPQKVLEHRTNKKLLIMKEEDEIDKKEREYLVFKIRNNFHGKNEKTGTDNPDGDFLNPDPRSQSEPVLNQNKEEIPNRAEAIQMSMKPGKVRQSMQADLDLDAENPGDEDLLRKGEKSKEN